MEKNKIPVHIAIQLDGNRRWGRKNKGDALKGHKEGALTLKKIVEHSFKIGVKILTVYALSIENLKRNKKELIYHFGLHQKYIKNWILDSDEFVKNKIKFQVLGRREFLPKKERELIQQAEEKTKDFNDHIFNVCICYNGQDELVDAIKKIVDKGVKPRDVTRALIKENLYTANLPPPEMMIKTGMNPEKRLSAFLLYDVAYSELFFSPILWPDFTPEELDLLIGEYNERERRFGK